MSTAQPRRQRRRGKQEQQAEAHEAAGARIVVRGDALAVPDVDTLLTELRNRVHPGDHVVFMSNGGFDGAPRRFVALLEAQGVLPAGG